MRPHEAKDSVILAGASRGEDGCAQDDLCDTARASRRLGDGYRSAPRKQSTNVMLLSFAGVIVNLAYIGITSVGFLRAALASHTLASVADRQPRDRPRRRGARIDRLRKMLVDWVVPDVPDSVKVKMEREDVT